MHHEKGHTDKSTIACIVPDPQRFSRLEKLHPRKAKSFSSCACLLRNQKMANYNNWCNWRGLWTRMSFWCESAGKRSFLYDCKSPLFTCSPFLDESGVMPVKDRINAIEGIEFAIQQPIILSWRHRVTYLNANYYHRRFHHIKNEIVANEMRQQYWNKGLKALVREVAKDCPTCRIRNARPEPPEMWSLPQERLSPYTPYR